MNTETIKRAPRMPRGSSYTCARCEEIHTPSLPPTAPDGVTLLSWQDCDTAELRAARDAFHNFKEHRGYDVNTERGQAIRRLREWCKPGDKLYTVMRRRSSSGMCRHISILKPDAERPGEMLDLTWNAARALEWRMNRDTGGLVVGGCGMDMGFHAVYSLSSVLFAKGFDCAGDGCPANDHSNARESCVICGAAPVAGRRGIRRNSLPGAVKFKDGRYNVCSAKCANATWHHRDGGYALRQGWI